MQKNDAAQKNNIAQKNNTASERACISGMGMRKWGIARFVAARICHKLKMRSRCAGDMRGNGERWKRKNMIW